MKQFMMIVLFILVSLPTVMVRADEIDDMVTQIKPPARFAGYTPHFTSKVGQLPVDAHSENGIQADTVTYIMDGEKYVGFFAPRTGRFHLITPDPTAANNKFKLSGPRYHFARFTSSAPSDSVWIFEDPNTISPAIITSPDNGKTLKYSIKREWTKKRNAVIDTTFIFSVDPQLGYVVNFSHILISDKLENDKGGKITKAEFCNMFYGDIANPWPGESKWDRTYYSDINLKSGEFTVWANNWVAADISDADKVHPPTVRTGGIVGVIDEKGGWSQALARSGSGTFTQATCNVWQDQHNQMSLPEKPGADGLFHANVDFRMAYLPPEISDYINKHTAMLYADRAAVMPRLGMLEDFESQPQALTSPVRGIREDDLFLSQKYAHSGVNSVMEKGVTDVKSRGPLSLAPQIILDANSRYHLEAWVYIEGDDTSASLTADLYQANVHWDARLAKLATNIVTNPGNWQKLLLDINTSATGIDPFTDLRFRVIGPGNAYFDDLQFYKITPDRTPIPTPEIANDTPIAGRRFMHWGI